MNLLTNIKNHQQKIVIALCFVLVAVIAFGLAKITGNIRQPPAIKTEEIFSLPNTSQNLMPTQSETSASPISTTEGDCEGKIKGNIGSSGLVFHVPGGSFYERTEPEICFNSEQEAIDAGFRKSSR